ncbi:tRNA 2-thiouridine(34) synthase MnmA [Bulleidia sp. zg-1006]|uniref:tRNA 2-thiouridine(34) synthase MnmA n=1 Tax=Bulleidia sp. zg-1006 TaxID=2806552 RepID=UPI001939F54D|nr:tRNA 2-thiouridine(34) synthase MnmA [Bulleidia sp. zg-1006]QRG87343.1 tRNA 2-thiouridine(34) synthase MnmA [Bulleidia sp. zg-1006]
MKILVGLSGGVDSAIAAYLLQKQGHDVTCAFMRNWDSVANGDFAGNPTLNDSVCSQESDYADAKAVADKLGLPLLRVDFIKEYWDDVFQTFLSEYQKGRTPNPDILCNRYIKFAKFMKFARQEGFETVATGHYVKLGHENGHGVLIKADDRNKDQSYFLAEVNREVLDHVLFPLAEVEKTEVRRIATELDLSIAKKKDSTGICFIGERDFRAFLSNYLPMKSGKIVNIVEKKVVGEHKGVLYYTIGQRKGLDIGGIGPFFVVGKNVETNILYVVDQEHRHWLTSDSCLVTKMNWLANRQFPLRGSAKFRYRQQDQAVTIEKIDEQSVLLKYPQGVEAVTPGQEAVLYDGDVMIAGGQIDIVYQNGQDLKAKVNQEGKQYRHE